MEDYKYYLNRKKLLKKWSSLSDFEVVKEVVSKGLDVWLCWEFLSNRNNMTTTEYEPLYQNEIKKYIVQLLSQGLLCEVENVFKNMKEDVESNIFQLAFECVEFEQQELIFKYLEQRNPDNFDNKKNHFQFHFQLLKQLILYPALVQKWEIKLEPFKLANIITLDNGDIQKLYLDIYFQTRCDSILEHLEKNHVWNYLVTTNNTIELITWHAFSLNLLNSKKASGLQKKYCEWPLEPAMIQTAIDITQTTSNALRNCFAIHGRFFEEELNNTLTVMARLSTTGTLNKNIDVFENHDIGRICLNKKHFYYILNYVNNELIKDEENPILQFISGLKAIHLQNTNEWIHITELANKFLENIGKIEQHPNIILFNYLKQESDHESTNVPFVDELKHRFIERSKNSSCVPNAYQILNKISGLDFNIDDIGSMEQRFIEEMNFYKKYGTIYQLSFLHLIKQHRSAFSIYKFFTDRLQLFSIINQSQLFNACKSTTSLATNFYADKYLVSHSIAFIEMLGFDSQLLRIFLGLCNRLGSGHIQNDFELLITISDQALKRKLLEFREFPFDEYAALMHIVSCNGFKKFPEEILRNYASENDWWHLIILIHFFELPLDIINSLFGYFQIEELYKNLKRCLSIEAKYEGRILKQKKKNSKFKKRFLKKNLGAGSRSNEKEFKDLPQGSDFVDVFAVILDNNSIQLKNLSPNVQSFLRTIKDKTNSSSLNLLINSFRFKSPVLCLLSITLDFSNLEWNWITYVAVSTNQCEEIKYLNLLKKDEFFWRLVENTVKSGYIDVLHKSFKIFFKNNPFLYLLEFLKCTQIEKDFADYVAGHLRSYLMYWSYDQIFIPLCNTNNQNDIIFHSVKLLLIHAEYNFDSAIEIQNLFTCICDSSIGELYDLVDFHLLSNIFDIFQKILKVGKTSIFNFESFISMKTMDYEMLLNTLINNKMFDAAIALATLLQLPISEIIYSKWIAELNGKDKTAFTIDGYEIELVQHSLPPEMLVNFFLLAASHFDDGTAKKYELMKNALEIIKKHHLFPNESFDRDQIEYETILCFIQIEDTNLANHLDVYHSEYYEQIMVKERCVLYKSFLELKELAGVEEISTGPKKPLSQKMVDRLEALITRLLNRCDIVEALRIQELFEFRPIDLRFIVFCMALAEGVASIINLPTEDRQLLNDIEKASFSLFNKRTLNVMQANENSPEKCEISNSILSFDFEVWPSKERSDTLRTVQGIASRLKSGIQIGKRVALAYRAAMYLDKDYLDVLRTKDVSVLLKSVAEDDCFQRLLVISDITTSTNMSAKEIADLIGTEITTAIIRPRFYIFNTGQQTNDFKNSQLWGYNIDKDFHLFLELTPNTTLLGNNFLEYCDALKAYRKFQDNKPYNTNSVFHNLSKIITQYGLPLSSSQSKSSTGSNPKQVLSHKKQNLIYVELLIKAHQCFLHECSMEGIANVLCRAKALNSILASAKSWSLIVQMLIGIGRYREMFYCFDTLVQNEQFESLLGQFDDEKAVGLRQGILAYLREHKPNNSKELFKLAALHFLMYKDLAEMWFEEAKSIHEKINSFEQVIDDEKYSNNHRKLTLKLLCSEETLCLLNQLLECYIHATESYLLDNKLLQAQKMISASELVAMQIDLVKKKFENSSSVSYCTSVINVQSKTQFCDVVNSVLSVPQIIILGRYCNHDINWSEVLFSHYIVQEKTSFLSEYLEHFDINDSVINNIVKSYQQFQIHNKSSAIMEQHLSKLIGLIKASTTKYKLASILSLKSTVISLISEDSIYYLKDMNFGRKN